MSTKTTFKRVALVTVAALGFGMLSTVATTAATVAAGATTGISADTTSITLVAAGAPSSSEYGAFELSLTNASGIAAPLQSTESLTATVVATPGATRTGANASGTGPTLPADITVAWSVDYDPTGRTVTSTNSAYNYLGNAGTNTLGAAYDNMDLSANLRGGITASHPTTAYTSSTSTATATSATRLMVVVVDICFLSISQTVDRAHSLIVRLFYLIKREE